MVEEEQRGKEGIQAVVNDFSIQVATVNGSGSQSSNSVLMRSIFQMGIPVSGKNLFPSNIAGLPTWFTIRANKDGWIARRKEIDFLIAMNPETAREDVLTIDPNRIVVYEETLQPESVPERSSRSSRFRSPNLPRKSLRIRGSASCWPT